MKVTIKKGLAARRIGGELFIVDAAGSRLHELNGTGAGIWAGLSAGRGVPAIAAALAAEYEVGAAEAAADIETFTAALAKAGLLEIAE